MEVKKTLFLILAAVLTYGILLEQGVFTPGLPDSIPKAGINLQKAYNSKKSNIQVQGKGVVVKILPDDRHGSKHQRFVIKLGAQQRLLVAHNIDIAPRIKHLNAGDVVEFYGEYEWDPRGGIIHWTHHDPHKHHVSGWLKHNGITYQ
jgi:hypothetical protein